VEMVSLAKAKMGDTFHPTSKEIAAPDGGVEALSIRHPGSPLRFGLSAGMTGWIQ